VRHGEVDVAGKVIVVEAEKEDEGIRPSFTA
jgi:hypothetical protein